MSKSIHEAIFGYYPIYIRAITVMDSYSMVIVSHRKIVTTVLSSLLM